MNKYRTEGVCAKEIFYEVEGNKVKNVKFLKGCPGSLLGISRLVEGMEVEKVIEMLKGVRCGGKDSSCPDQLAKALETLKKG